MSGTDHERWRDDLSAYVLGALEPGEAVELEGHLASCEACREELDWLRPAVQVLPESVGRREAPPELRSRLLEQVRSEAGTTGASQRGFHWLPQGWSFRPVAGLTALALVVASLAAYVIGGSGSDGGGMTTVVAGRSPGVTAKVIRNGDSGTLHLANLKRLPQGEVLQAWVQRGDRVVSAMALFEPNPDGTASATIDEMNGVDTVMVTAEPRGGSVQPTSPPIVSVSMPQ